MTQTNDPPLVASVELIPDSDEKADLDGPSGSGGKLVIGQAPNITITETSVVADAAERLALDVQEGDVAIQTNVSSSFIFTGGDNVAPNWEVLDFDAVGAIDGEDINPSGIAGSNISSAGQGQVLTSDGTGGLSFVTPEAGSEVVRNGSTIEYVALDIANLPNPTTSATALLTATDEYAEFTPITPQPFDITNRNLVAEIDLNFVASDMALSPSGNKMFVSETDADRIVEYTLNTPFDITDRTEIQSFTDGVFDSPSGVELSDNGEKLFIADDQFELVREYDLPNPYSLTGATEIDNISLPQNAINGITFSDNGNKLYVLTREISEDVRVQQFDLTTSFDLSTATLVKTRNTNSTSIEWAGFTPDGITYFEIVLDDVKIFTASTAFEVDTVSLNQTLTFGPQRRQALTFSNDGTKLYGTTRFDTGTMQQFNLESGGWETI